MTWSRVHKVHEIKLSEDRKRLRVKHRQIPKPRRGKDALGPEIAEQEIDQEIEIEIETEAVRDMPKENEESTIEIGTLESIPEEEREAEVVMERDFVAVMIKTDEGRQEEALRHLPQAPRRARLHRVRGEVKVPRGIQENKSACY